MKAFLMVGVITLLLAWFLLRFRQWLVRSPDVKPNRHPVYLIRFEGEPWSIQTDEEADRDSRRAVIKIKLPSIIIFRSADRKTSAPEARSGLKKWKICGLVGFLAISAHLLCRNGQAQQTVFNVPTTDVLDRGKVYAELDISVKPNTSQTLSRFSSFVPRIVVGIGHDMEIGVNVLGNIQPGPDSTMLSPVIKWKMYNGKENGWAIITGAHLFIPVRNKSYNAGVYNYVAASKTFKTNTRVGFGGYFFSQNVVAPHANRAGGQFSFEQTLTKKLSIDADYFTGKMASGYLTSGVIYKPINKLTVYAGYSIGNDHPSQGNHFFLLELGYNFN